MSDNKKYFWFKMEDDFFQKKEIKKLRSIAGGDTFVIIYLKIILLSLKNGGKLYYEGIDDNFISELALEIDEQKDNVGITMEYLLKHSAILQIDGNEYKVNTINNLIGGETSSAIRVRKHREKVKLLQCNADVTPMKQIVNGELELELELELEIKKEIKKEGFIKPTLTEIKCYLDEKLITSFTADSFYNFYESKGWMIGKNKMKSWRHAIGTWNEKAKNEPKKQLKPFRAMNPALDNLPQKMQDDISNSIMNDPRFDHLLHPEKYIEVKK